MLKSAMQPLAGALWMLLLLAAAATAEETPMSQEIKLRPR